jgi:hypothetical protein
LARWWRVDELYKLIKRDLEEVVEEEVKALVSLVDCPKARVTEDTAYFEFRLESPPNPPNLPFNLPRLPTLTIYIPKAYVTVLEFKVEFVRENDVPLAMAIVKYYFTTSTPTACFKDYLIIPANIEDAALEIIRGGGEWGD